MDRVLVIGLIKFAIQNYTDQGPNRKEYEESIHQRAHDLVKSILSQEQYEMFSPMIQEKIDDDRKCFQLLRERWDDFLSYEPTITHELSGLLEGDDDRKLFLEYLAIHVPEEKRTSPIEGVTPQLYDAFKKEALFRLLKYGPEFLREQFYARMNSFKG